MGSLSPTTPLSVSGCLLWLNGANAATVTGTTTVTAWADSSGNGNNMTVSGSGVSYASGGVAMTGSGAFYSSLSSLLQNQTGFAVVQYASTIKMDVISLTDSSSTAGLQQTLQGNQQVVTSYGGATVVQSSAGAVSEGAMLLYDYSFAAGVAAYVYANGTQTGTTSTPAALAGAGTVNVGGYGISGEPYKAEGFVGTIYEVILYNSVLTTAQRQLVEGYLAIKWGFQASLPASHPYSVQNYPMCFLRGTRILTPRGYARIEDLKRGQLVETSEGRAVAIAAVKRQRVDLDGGGPSSLQRFYAQPCVLRAGVLGATHDLYLSPRHGVFADGGALVPVGTLPQAERAGLRGWIEYLHLQLEDATADLVANGVPCESFGYRGPRRRRGHPPRSSSCDAAASHECLEGAR
jgi:hypothetical protein